MSITSEYCFPSEFLCEHTASRSRVFVRLVAMSQPRPEALKAVLTCADADLADRAAEVLNLVGTHPVCDALAASIEAALPAAPAASFREALERAHARKWPIRDMRPVTPDNRDRAAADRDRARGAANGGAAIQPDFAALFPVVEHDCDSDCPATHLTPRTADLLYSALTTLADEAYDDIAEFRGEPVDAGDGIEWSVFARLPQASWREGVGWRRQFGRSCDDLASDLAEGRAPLPRCEAEQMALLLAIADAPDFLPGRDREARAATDTECAAEAAHHALPEYQWDYDWAGCAAALCRHHHVVLVLITGAPRDDEPGNALPGLASDAWFTWYADAERRDPDRGFRR